MHSCSRPLHAFQVGVDIQTGKPIYKIKPYYVSFIHKPKFKIEHYEDRTYRENSGNVWTDVFIKDYIEIPCGNCEICKANQAEQKSKRALAESKAFDNNYVLNLTYNDENLPLNEKADGTKVATLKYKDVQDFKKRLLKHWKVKYNEDGIRFICACEYGEKYQRPHYHIIMFNFKPKDLKYYGQTLKGSKEWGSPEIAKIWGKGNITVGECSEKTISYVANYCLKKFKGKEAKEYYQKLGIEPEKVTQSNRKGLGASFLESHINTYATTGKYFLGTINGVISMGANKYADKIVEKKYGEAYLKNLKEQRQQKAKSTEETRAFVTGVAIETQRKIDEESFLNKIKKAKSRNFKESGY